MISHKTSPRPRTHHNCCNKITDVSNISLHNLSNVYMEEKSWLGPAWPGHTLACPARSTPSRRDNQSMRERFWLGQRGQP